jgi:cytoskeletal protein CcmA (bactofilin family)
MGIFGKQPDSKPTDPVASPAPRPAPAPSPAPAAYNPAPQRGSAPPAPAPVSSGSCVLGANITVKGDITGDEDLLIEGTVEGQIRVSRELRVGPRGKVRANVSAQSVVVSGELVGDCEATSRVEIQATGRVMGNIRAPKVVIAEGAVFRGNSDMSGRREERKDRVAIS